MAREEMPKFLRWKLGWGITVSPAALGAPIQPNIMTQGGKKMAGALKFWAFQPSELIYTLSLSSNGTTSMKTSMTASLMCLLCPPFFQKHGFVLACLKPGL